MKEHREITIGGGRYIENTQQGIYIENVSIPNINQSTEDSYQSRLGKRHKYLREKYLQFNPREMADFYRYEKVLQLESYEKGDDEFPYESLKKLEEIFFINRKYLEEGNSRIFRTVELSYEEMKSLLKKGFRPYFLCCPPEFEPDHSELMTRIVFYKREVVNNYNRIVAATFPGYFTSSGDGYHNIAQVMRAMIDLGMKDIDAFVGNVRASNWQKIEKGQFYSRYGLLGGWHNFQCRDIFDDWYKELNNQTRNY